jgi:glutathione S-transferase
MYRLYVIPGSHACRSAILMLEHKEVPYRRVDVLTLTHPVVARLLGFDAGGETRRVGGRRTFGIRFGDLLGTVPALAMDGRRVSTNRQIARALDEHHPAPPLFPADPQLRRAAEEAEAWANDDLQMVARRLTLTYALRDPAGAARAGADGRMGYLLYRRERTRRLVIPWIGRRVFAAGGSAERELLAELHTMLDRIDALIAEGILNGTELNAADFMVAPCLALLLYRPDMKPLLEGRPALELVDRVLPEPAASTTGRPTSAPASPRGGIRPAC